MVKLYLISMKKIITILLGIFIMGFGTAVCNMTGLGIDPINAFCQAIAEWSGFGVGIITLGIQAILGILILILNRQFLGWGSLIPMVAFGYALQLFNWLLPEIKLSLGLNILIFFIGAIIIALGMSVYMSVSLGMVPYDGLAYVIASKWGGKVPVLRIIQDLIIACLAFLMGGPINIGTFIIAFCIGPIVSYFRNRIFHSA